jgi:hypothetical protein
MYPLRSSKVGGLETRESEKLNTPAVGKAGALTGFCFTPGIGELRVVKKVLIFSLLRMTINFVAAEQDA